ncbi:glutathione synthase [Chondromyces apiculatus]|uniref:Glutathione synthetase n=1 Tax=Chondromyces apiculatus DSM 436 TaxID=1192034 RepID=A0A017TC35_9BACT|nr:glutathione synthase [Chondromyces apiculatus]EYF06467.1 Glutathione synthetase [Chondromyces apiculatus DSM 436]
MRFVFVMDPLITVHHQKDTTFAFIRAAQARGHESYHCMHGDLSIAGGEAYARVRRVAVHDAPPYISFVSSGEGSPERERVRLSDADAIFIRKDPPFDRSYLYATLVLENARKCPLILNDPRGLRDANEKLYALNFPEWTPRTIVTADPEEIHAFAREFGSAVVKPLDGAGGMGVLRLTPGDKNGRAIVDMLTFEGRRLAMAQEYLPSVVEGDKRILLLDGEPLGSILRVPRSDDLRSNIHVGGSVVPTELTERELAMVQAITPKLRADGLFFVGLDVIGGRLTEVNVTSPTGIQELNRFTGVDHAAKVVAWAEERVRAVRS